MATLAEGERITLIENTGIVSNGYPWFKVLSNSQPGYQWGGIIYALGEPIEGASSGAPQ